MSNLFKMFKTDKSVERDGVWLNFGPISDEPGAPETKIKIARAGGANSQFDKRRESLLKPYRHQIQHDIFPEEMARKVMHQLFAETVVLDWENVYNDQGVKLDCTVENIMYLFGELPDMFTQIKTNAEQTTLFREYVREADAKN